MSVLISLVELSPLEAFMPLSARHVLVYLLNQFGFSCKPGSKSTAPLAVTSSHQISVLSLMDRSNQFGFSCKPGSKSTAPLAVTSSHQISVLSLMDRSNQFGFSCKPGSKSTAPLAVTSSRQISVLSLMDRSGSMTSPGDIWPCFVQPLLEYQESADYEYLYAAPDFGMHDVH
ncbi:hypothetical protein BDQ17DRAFT_1434855 [Cyathus striatus]|nr:hypothetical protein BDQ17DRAFT_1434855 [Cyathus striatus]